MPSDADLPEIIMDANNLFREESYSDRKIGTVRVMTPVNSDGSVDVTRKTEYLGQSQMMSPMGAVPLAFELEAENLAEAIEKFPEAAKESLKSTLEEIREMQRQQASSIVMPDGSQGGMPPMGGGGGF